MEDKTVKNTAGKVIGVGVGPGDPELMTCKAIRTIKEADVIAAVGTNPAESVAYRTAVKMVPEMAHKRLVGVNMPMVSDKVAVEAVARANVAMMEGILDEGQDIVYLTLGDPAIYSTFTYLQRFFEADGYETLLVSGVPSFCAGAASLNIPIAEWDEQLHIIPAIHENDFDMKCPGNYVLMKSGKHLGVIRKRAEDNNLRVYAVENCGMDSEKIYGNADEIPDSAGYFSIVFTKEI